MKLTITSYSLQEESLSSSSGEESESESEREQTSPELEPKQRVDFNHILNSLQPQYVRFNLFHFSDWTYFVRNACNCNCFDYNFVLF